MSRSTRPNIPDTQYSGDDVLTRFARLLYRLGNSPNADLQEPAQDALAVIDCYRFIRINENFIKAYFHHREHSPGQFYNWVNAPHQQALEAQRPRWLQGRHCHQRRDQESGVLRDHNKISFHLNQFTALQVPPMLQADSCWTSLTAAMSAMEEAIQFCEETHRTSIFITLFNFDDTVGCLDAREATAMRMVEKWKGSDIEDLEDLVAHRVAYALSRIRDEDHACYEALRLMLPYFGKLVKLEGKAVVLTVENYFNYLAEMDLTKAWSGDRPENTIQASLKTELSHIIHPSAERATQLIQQEKGLIKSFRAGLDSGDSLNYTFNLLLNPEVVRPIKPLSGDRDRSIIWNPQRSQLTRRDIAVYRGLPRRLGAHSKKTSLSLMPRNGRIRTFYQTKDTVAFLFNLDYCNNKGFRYVWIGNASSDRKFWVGREGDFQGTSFNQLRQYTRNVIMNDGCVTEHSELLMGVSLAALSAIIATHNTLFNRLNALRIQLQAKAILAIDLPILIADEHTQVHSYEREQMLRDIRSTFNSRDIELRELITAIGQNEADIIAKLDAPPNGNILLEKVMAYLENGESLNSQDVEEVCLSIEWQALSEKQLYQIIDKAIPCVHVQVIASIIGSQCDTTRNREHNSDMVSHLMLLLLEDVSIWIPLMEDPKVAPLLMTLLVSNADNFTVFANLIVKSCLQQGSDLWVAISEHLSDKHKTALYQELIVALASNQEEETLEARLELFEKINQHANSALPTVNLWQPSPGAAHQKSIMLRVAGIADPRVQQVLLNVGAMDEAYDVGVFEVWASMGQTQLIMNVLRGSYHTVFFVKSVLEAYVHGGNTMDDSLFEAVRSFCSVKQTITLSKIHGHYIHINNVNKLPLQLQTDVICAAIQCNDDRVVDLCFEFSFPVIDVGSKQYDEEIIKFAFSCKKFDLVHRLLENYSQFDLINFCVLMAREFHDSSDHLFWLVNNFKDVISQNDGLRACILRQLSSMPVEENDLISLVDLRSLKKQEIAQIISDAVRFNRKAVIDHCLECIPLWQHGAIEVVDSLSQQSDNSDSALMLAVLDGIKHYMQPNRSEINPKTMVRVVALGDITLIHGYEALGYSIMTIECLQAAFRSRSVDIIIYAILTITHCGESFPLNQLHIPENVFALLYTRGVRNDVDLADRWMTCLAASFSDEESLDDKKRAFRILFNEIIVKNVRPYHLDQLIAMLDRLIKDETSPYHFVAEHKSEWGRFFGFNTSTVSAAIDEAASYRTSFLSSCLTKPR